MRSVRIGANTDLCECLHRFCSRHRGPVEVYVPAQVTVRCMIHVNRMDVTPVTARRLRRSVTNSSNKFSSFERGLRNSEPVTSCVCRHFGRQFLFYSLPSSQCFPPKASCDMVCVKQPDSIVDVSFHRRKSPVEPSTCSSQSLRCSQLLQS